MVRPGFTRLLKLSTWFPARTIAQATSTTRSVLGSIPVVSTSTTAKVASRNVSGFARKVAVFVFISSPAYDSGVPDVWQRTHAMLRVLGCFAVSLPVEGLVKFA